MPFRCAISHDTSRSQVLRNGRVKFSSCSRCGGILIRRGGAWRPIPDGFRVVVGVMSARALMFDKPPRPRGCSPAAAFPDLLDQPRATGKPHAKLRRSTSGLFGAVLHLLAWRLLDEARCWWKTIPARRSKQAHVIALPSRTHSFGI